MYEPTKKARLVLDGYDYPDQTTDHNNNHQTISILHADDDVRLITEMSMTKNQYHGLSLTKIPVKTYDDNDQLLGLNDIIKNVDEDNGAEMNSFKNYDDKTGLLSSPFVIQDIQRFHDLTYIWRDCRNAGDEDGVVSLLLDTYTEDCTIKTPALATPLVGRHLHIEFNRSLFRSVPNMSVVVNDVAVTNNNKLITADLLATGNIISRDTSDYLWNNIGNRPENQSYSKQLQARVFRMFTTAAYVGNMLTGFVINFRVESNLQLILNDERTHIESVVLSRKWIELKLVRPPPSPSPSFANGTTTTTAPLPTAAVPAVTTDNPA